MYLVDFKCNISRKINLLKNKIRLFNNIGAKLDYSKV